MGTSKRSHTCCENVQYWNRTWHIVSVFRLQEEHVGATWIPWVCNRSSTTNAPTIAFHKKWRIFGTVGTFHNLEHNCIFTGESALYSCRSGRDSSNRYLLWTLYAPFFVYPYATESFTWLEVFKDKMNWASFAIKRLLIKGSFHFSVWQSNKSTILRLMSILYCKCAGALGPSSLIHFSIQTQVSLPSPIVFMSPLFNNFRHAPPSIGGSPTHITI